MLRKFNVQSGVAVNPALFDALAEWDSVAVNSFTNLGYHECLCTVGIKEINKGASISVYPNPSNNGTAIIRASDLITTVELYNNLGSLVFSESINSMNKTYILSTEGFSKGIYSVALRLKNGSKAVSKISIQ